MHSLDIGAGRTEPTSVSVKARLNGWLCRCVPWITSSSESILTFAKISWDLFQHPAILNNGWIFFLHPKNPPYSSTEFRKETLLHWCSDVIITNPNNVNLASLFLSVNYLICANLLKSSFLILYIVIAIDKNRSFFTSTTSSSVSSFMVIATDYYINELTMPLMPDCDLGIGKWKDISLFESLVDWSLLRSNLPFSKCSCLFVYYFWTWYE